MATPRAGGVNLKQGWVRRCLVGRPARGRGGKGRPRLGRLEWATRTRAQSRPPAPVAAPPALALDRSFEPGCSARPGRCRTRAARERRAVWGPRAGATSLLPCYRFPCRG